ncbi:MAG: SufE family protein [Kineosporiaceae bacterium]|nr:SufE family protein [Kineosporiaceae bacterium]
MIGTPLPPVLADIAEEFGALAPGDRLQMLVDFADELPELPAHIAARRDDMEPVAECQSPVFVLVELDEHERLGDLDDPADPTPHGVHVHVRAPAQSPTTRGFAAVLCQGLDGVSAAAVLGLPDDLPDRLGLSGVVSPLRRNGMAGLLRRIKRQVRELTEPAAAVGTPVPR